MSTAKGTLIYNHLVRFLTAIGANEFEDLEALATSFKEIVAMIGSKYSAITLMKLRNALWHSTGMPQEMTGKCQLQMCCTC